MKEARHARPCDVQSHLHEMSRIGKALETESGFVVGRGRDRVSELLMGGGFPLLCGDRQALELN